MRFDRRTDLMGSASNSCDMPTRYARSPRRRNANRNRPPARRFRAGQSLSARQRDERSVASRDTWPPAAAQKEPCTWSIPPFARGDAPTRTAGAAALFSAG